MLSFFKNNQKLLFGILVALVGVAGSYYLLQLKRPAQKASSFERLQINWGTGKALPNSYDSKSGIYHYQNRAGQPVAKRFLLRTTEIMYVNTILDQYNFWQMPTLLANQAADTANQQLLRYELQLTYNGQSKKLLLMAGYNKNHQVQSNANNLFKALIAVIDNAEERYTK